MLIDTHCHIDRFPDPMSLASECESAPIKVVAVTNLPSHYEIAVEHIGNLQHVKPALGFHPLSVADNANELPRFLSLLSDAEFVGEIGLDFSKQGLASKPQQLDVFRAISEALAFTPRVTTLHSRRAEAAVLETLQEAGVKQAIFHWFSGTKKSLTAAIDDGHYFSVNTAMLTSQSGQRVLEDVPRDRLLTETDGPYVKLGGKPSQPADVSAVLSGIAQTWNVSPEEAERQVAENFARLCGAINVEL